MRVIVFGLGRIGLPISLVCADSGFQVTGIDINKELINSIRKNKIPFNEPGLEKLLKKHLNKNFIPKLPEENIYKDIKKADYIMIAVGTGFARYPEKPNLSRLFSIVDQIINTGIKNKTIILRVTLPIGTSDEIIKTIENKTSLKAGKDFFFAFVPERIMEGKAVEEEKKLPKIIGAYSDKDFEKVSSFFKKIGGEIVRVSNPRTAELIKLIDNSWRNNRFAFANELAFLADANNIDVIEAINSANKGYKRNQIPTPGPVSGYCLGKDPYLLELAFAEIAKQRGFNSVWYIGRQANDWLYEKVIEEIKGKKILIAGLTFKENIDDFRYSHSIEIIKKLLTKDYSIYVTDPFLDENTYTKLPEEIDSKVKKYDSIEKATKEDVDTIVLTVRHKEFQNINWDKILKNIKKTVKVVDLWNMYPELRNNKKVEYKGFGRN